MKYDLVSGEWGEEYRYRNSDGDEIAFSLDPKIPFGVTMRTPAHKDATALVLAFFHSTISTDPKIPCTLFV